MNTVKGWQENPVKFARSHGVSLSPEAEEADSEKGIHILIVEGFLIYNYQWVISLFLLQCPRNLQIFDLSANLSLCSPSPGLLLTSTMNVSTFPFLMRSARRGEGNQLFKSLTQTHSGKIHRLKCDWIHSVSAAQGHTQSLTPLTCLTATSGPCT